MSQFVKGESNYFAFLAVEEECPELYYGGGCHHGFEDGTQARCVAPFNLLG